MRQGGLIVKSKTNLTSDDRFVKTTINIRPKMMAGVHERMLELAKEDFVDYLRDLIKADLEHKILGNYSTFSLKDFRDEIGWPTKENLKDKIARANKKKYLNPAPYLGPPKKYSGFLARMQARFHQKNWWYFRNDEWKQEQVRLMKQNDAF